MKVSYYELLGMIKEGDIPKEIYVQLQIGLNPVKYVPEYDLADGSLTCFTIFNREEEDTNYHYYLTDCFIEMSVFDKCIEIIEEEKEMEKIPIPEIESVGNERILRAEIRINELIDEIKKLKDSSVDKEIACRAGEDTLRYTAENCCCFFYYL